ncbi:lipopolysaccharide biosynthesis protein [Cellulomonas sp.]|uniref:lipopolysaccharide biosynthesis protein n=1 Tax=Cellulomonas sp. TaxID=40001 RepID=UPI003BACA203
MDAQSALPSNGWSAVMSDLHEDGEAAAPLGTGLRRAFRSPSVMIVARVPVLLAGLVIAPLLARGLGPSQRGYVAAATAALAIAPVVLGFGVPMAIRHRSAIQEPAPFVRAGALLALFATIPAAIVGYLLWRVALPDLDGATGWTFVAVMAMTPAFLQVLNDQSVLIARNQYGRVAAIQSAQPLIYASVIGIWWSVAELSVRVVVGAYGASMLGAALIGYVLVAAPLWGKRSGLAALAREGVPYAGGQIAEIASSRLDQVLMVSVIGSSGAGWYSVAALLGSLPVVIGQTIGAATFRTVALLSEKERPHARSAILRAALVLGGSIGVLGAAVVPWAVPLLFGPEFVDAVAPSMVLVLVAPFVVGGHVAAMMLAAEGRGRAMTAAQVSGLVAGIALLLTLGPVLGVLGAAIASACGYVTVAAIATARLKLPLRDLRLRRGDLPAAGSLLRHGVLRRTSP